MLWNKTFHKLTSYTAQTCWLHETWQNAEQACAKSCKVCDNWVHCNTYRVCITGTRNITNSCNKQLVDWHTLVKPNSNMVEFSLEDNGIDKIETNVLDNNTKDYNSKSGRIRI